MKYLSYAVTDVGKKRNNNEDRFLNLAEKNLFIVADGMGGGKQGALAAEMAVEFVKNHVIENYSIVDVYKVTGSDENRKMVIKMLTAAVVNANAIVYKESLKSRRPVQMGATFTLFMAVGDSGFMVHAGDSRFYLVRNGEISQISTDHNIREDYLRKYGKEPENIDTSYGDMLTKAVGIAEFLEPEAMTFDIMTEDRILLCSDGLHKYFKGHNFNGLKQLITKDVETRERELEYIEQLSHNLIDFAYNNGADDNITVVVVSAQDTSDDEVTGSRELQIKFDVIRNSGLFKALTYPELLKIMEKAEIRTHNKYDIVLNEGREMSEKEILLLIEGHVTVLRKSKVITRLGPGDHFGDMSLLDEGPRSATIFVDKPSTFLILNKSAFLEIIRDYPEIGVKVLWELAATLSRRLRLAITFLDS